jgi:hypothetical protein
VPSTIVLGSIPLSQSGKLIVTDDEEPTNTSPFESTATHSAVVGHEIAFRSNPAETVPCVQALFPPVGLVET